MTIAKCRREQQIEVIEESFRAAKLRPKHLTKPELEAVEILPLVPDFERYNFNLPCVDALVLFQKR